jgi:CheY-like chemotaxis protein
LEDDPNDAALVQSTLEAEGIICAITCVQARDDFVVALEHGGIDLIISDFSLPAFDGLSAVGTVRAKWPDLPFILVSGTLGEELAIDSLKSGAIMSLRTISPGSFRRCAAPCRKSMNGPNAGGWRRTLSKRKKWK